MTILQRNVDDTVLDSAGARTLTDAIKRATNHLWDLLIEAYDRQAWKALGYVSFREYAKAEFGMGSSHAYRLLDQGRVIRHIEQATGYSPTGELITERVARDIKPHIVTVTGTIEQQIAAGNPPETAITEAIETIRRPTTYLGSRKRSERPNREVETIVVTVDGMLDGVDRIDLARVDRELSSVWAADLRRSARRLSRLATARERVAR